MKYKEFDNAMTLSLKNGDNCPLDAGDLVVILPSLEVHKIQMNKVYDEDWGRIKTFVLGKMLHKERKHHFEANYPKGHLCGIVLSDIPVGEKGTVYATGIVGWSTSYIEDWKGILK